MGVHVTDTASANAAGAVDASAVIIHVGVYNKPTAGGLTADPAVLDRGQSSNLHVNATGSECGGTLTYSWAAAEGTVSGNGADAQYNSSGVAFNESDLSRPQSKPVTITATVTDSQGRLRERLHYRDRQSRGAGASTSAISYSRKTAPA